MPTPIKFKAPFCPEEFYHVVCKSIDGLLLFPNEIDHLIFMERLKHFTGAFFDIWSYCLLTNHTHHVVRIKSLKAILENIENTTEIEKTQAMRSFLSDLEIEKLFDAMIERQMNSFLVSFANYHNNKYKRKGGLFQKPFRRIQICDDSHLQQAVIYVNSNAQKHNLITDFRQYPYSSYNEVIQNNNKFIDTKAVLSFFGGIEKFIDIHKRQVEYYYGASWPSSKIE